MKDKKKQQKEWFLKGKCHVCGSDQPHTHPRWMWLANPAPIITSGKYAGHSKKLREENIDELKQVVGVF